MQPWQNYRKNLLTSNVGLTPYFPNSPGESVNQSQSSSPFSFGPTLRTGAEEELLAQNTGGSLSFE